MSSNVKQQGSGELIVTPGSLTRILPIIQPCDLRKFPPTLLGAHFPHLGNERIGPGDRWCVRFSSSWNISISLSTHTNDVPPRASQVGVHKHSCLNYGCHWCFRTGKESWPQLKLTVPLGYLSFFLPAPNILYSSSALNPYLPKINISPILTNSPQTLI